jgi:hypothetical protein
MKAEVIERSAAVVLGMAAGYLLWLAGITALTAVVPMRYIIVAAAILLSVIVFASFAAALHFKRAQRRSVALAFWWAPALPTVASLYSLIVILS